MKDLTEVLRQRQKRNWGRWYVTCYIMWKWVQSFVFWSDKKMYICIESTNPHAIQPSINSRDGNQKIIHNDAVYASKLSSTMSSSTRYVFLFFAVIVVAIVIILLCALFFLPPSILHTHAADASEQKMGEDRSKRVENNGMTIFKTNFNQNSIRKILWSINKRRRRQL